MDARRFDALARALRAAGSRRGLLGLLAGFPLVGGLALFLDDEAADAKGQRKRHKKPHHHRKHAGNRAGNKKKRHCKPNSKATTCAGKCGQVKNNCKKTVDCGSCVCNPSCAVCQVCDETTGSCVPNPETVGDACDTCHVCDSAGECVSVADGTSCDDDNACTQVDTCQGGICTGSDPVVCQPLDQCHESGTCDPETGLCSNPVKPDGMACDDGNPCTTGDVCTNGVCAGEVDPALDHVCGPCPSGEWCDAGACADIQATLTVVECGSRCSVGTDIATTTICGQSVTCPNCDQNCGPQTGCDSRSFLPDGPAGASWYCSTQTVQDCTTTSDCPSGLYCSASTQCTRVCPF